MSNLLRLVYDIGTSLMKDPKNRYIIPKISIYPDGSYECYIPSLFKSLTPQKAS